MAPQGDTRSYRGRGGGGGGGSYYDDHGRGYSKSLWEQFRQGFEYSGYSRDYLFTLERSFCWRIVQHTTERFNLLDFLRKWATEEQEKARGYKTDSRARRLITQKFDEKTWYEWHKFVTENYERQEEEDKINRAKRGEEYETERRSAEAKAAIIRLEEKTAIMKEVELTAGALRSDFNTAFTIKETYNQHEGDWIDDIVETYLFGSGFGEERREASGIKVQVTVSLDCSNSMMNNGVDEYASNAFRTIGLTLKALAEENPDSLFVNFFVFSKGEDGKGANSLKSGWGWERRGNDEGGIGVFEDFRNARQTRWGRHSDIFSGEDTWIAPLFHEIEKWENADSDPTAVRLDLIITDAVLEHPMDIRTADRIQEHRNGNLQTVLLNFMPESDWLGSTLPRKCVQYKANEENIAGLLRQVLQDFLAVYV